MLQQLGMHCCILQLGEGLEEAGVGSRGETLSWGERLSAVAMPLPKLGEARMSSPVGGCPTPSHGGHCQLGG